MQLVFLNYTGFNSVAYLEEAKSLLEKDSDETMKFTGLSETSMTDSKTSFDIELSISSRRNSDIFEDEKEEG